MKVAQAYGTRPEIYRMRYLNKGRDISQRVPLGYQRACPMRVFLRSTT
jgi:hypothetical protein